MVARSTRPPNVWATRRWRTGPSRSRRCTRVHPTAGSVSRRHQVTLHPAARRGVEQVRARLELDDGEGGVRPAPVGDDVPDGEALVRRLDVTQRAAQPRDEAFDGAGQVPPRAPLAELHEPGPDPRWRGRHGEGPVHDDVSRHQAVAREGCQALDGRRPNQHAQRRVSDQRSWRPPVARCRRHGWRSLRHPPRPRCEPSSAVRAEYRRRLRRPVLLRPRDASRRRRRRARRA